jgi:hypothetical protein
VEALKGTFVSRQAEMKTGLVGIPTYGLLAIKTDKIDGSTKKILY